jgi:hypothetical protein
MSVESFGRKIENFSPLIPILAPLGPAFLSTMLRNPDVTLKHLLKRDRTNQFLSQVQNPVFSHFATETLLPACYALQIEGLKNIDALVNAQALPTVLISNHGDADTGILGPIIGLNEVYRAFRENGISKSVGAVFSWEHLHDLPEYILLGMLMKAGGVSVLPVLQAYRQRVVGQIPQDRKHNLPIDEETANQTQAQINKLQESNGLLHIVVEGRRSGTLQPAEPIIIWRHCRDDYWILPIAVTPLDIEYHDSITLGRKKRPFEVTFCEPFKKSEALERIDQWLHNHQINFDVNQIPKLEIPSHAAMLAISDVFPETLKSGHNPIKGVYNLHNQYFLDVLRGEVKLGMTQSGDVVLVRQKKFHPLSDPDKTVKIWREAWNK